MLLVKNLPANSGDVRDPGLIPRLGRSPGGGHGHSLQYSCLENPMERGAWRASPWTHKESDTMEQLSTYWSNVRRSYLLPPPTPSLPVCLHLYHFTSSLPLFHPYLLLLKHPKVMSHILSLQNSLTCSSQSLLQGYPTEGRLTFLFKTVSLCFTSAIYLSSFVSFLSLLAKT